MFDDCRIVRFVRPLFVVFLMVLATGDIASAETESFDPLAARHVADARARTLQTCRDLGIELPTDFIAWIDSDPILQASVYGCREDPLPVLLGLRSLEIDLGRKSIRDDYTQLAIAFALSGSYAASDRTASAWNDGDVGQPDDGLPDVTPRSRLILECPQDPRVPVDTKDPTRALDVFDHVITA